MSRIVGLAALNRKYERIGNLAGAVAPAVTKATDGILGRAQEDCPVDTGALKASLASDVETGTDAVTGTAYTDKEYARYVEQGTYKMAAQPYLYPALKDHEEEVTEQIAEAARRAIRGIAGA